MVDSFASDVEAIERIEAVPTILEVVCRTTGMGFAAVARVTEDRWIACGVKDDIAFGLKPGGELKIETTICNEIRDSREAVIIDHVAEDPAFVMHHTPKIYGFQSYISMPIILPDGTFFGTLCAIDPRPARLNAPEVIGMFKLFADLIAFHLDAQQRLAASEASLLDERKTAELRDQFIAVLGHDLRSPLASIASGARLIGKTPMNDKAQSLLALVQSSVNRMSGLIENVLDFARGKLGDGLTVERKSDQLLQPMFEQVIAEQQSSRPDHRIATDLYLAEPVHCDPVRIGQLLSNLVGNALAHGAADKPVSVTASTIEGELTISVANAGEPIPPGVVNELFKPFFRASNNRTKQGLGLGLYIAAEIAKAHGGTLEVASSPDETRFTFRMKCQ